MDNNEEPTLEDAIKRSMLAKSKLAIILKNPGGVVNYSCVECSAQYDDIEQLQMHLLDHNKEYRFICGICGTGLKRKEHLDRHTLEHQEVRPHVCPDCGKAFKRKEHLNIHRSIHTGAKSESCSVCGKSFYRKDHLRKHLQTHTKMFLENNADVSADREFDDIKQEIIDEYSKISEDHDEEMMEIQEEKYSTSQEFNESLSNPRPYMCLVCNKSYKRKDHLKIHSWTHMKKDKVCSECGKAFHKQEQLLSHMTVHLQPYSMYSGDEDYANGEPIESEAYSSDNSLLIARSSRYSESRPHECDICHRRFKRKQHLKAHLNVHAKHHFTVWCSVCGEGFLSNEHFETHQCLLAAQESVSVSYEEEQAQLPQVYTPQEAKKENKYPQEYMDVGELATLDSVQYLEVEESELPTPQRVFVCKFCSKPFKRKDHYKIHLHIHTGVKSFFCPECGKGFYRKDHLQKHALVHNKPRTITQKPKKEIPDLYPIKIMPRKKEIIPEITIHAPSNTKLRVPLQIKVPYQMVMSMDNGEQRAVTIDPQASATVS